MGLFGCTNANHHLVLYRKTCGGGMTGEKTTTEVSIINDVTYLTDAHSAWYDKDDSKTEYAVDKAILNEIETIFNQYGMKKWNNKKFSNMFVNDGKSTSYTFVFDDGTEVSFLSQIYPGQYAKKLSEFEDVIEKYREPGRRIKEENTHGKEN